MSVTSQEFGEMLSISIGTTLCKQYDYTIFIKPLDLAVSNDTSLATFYTTSLNNIGNNASACIDPKVLYLYFDSGFRLLYGNLCSFY